MCPNTWSASKFSKEIELNKIKFLPEKSKYKKNWEQLPDEIINKIKKEKIDIFKFGMGLLDTNKINTKYGVLSFHHGNPEKYRGRPAGFYEILNNENFIGAIVQKINNTIDKGEILSFGKFKIYKHSYKKTLENLYSQSSFLLNNAFENEIGKTVNKIDLNSNVNYINYQIIF